MLSEAELTKILNDDSSSKKKNYMKVCQNYYEGIHDIKDYRVFYYNADGQLVEDHNRSNVRISHPFFTELVDQAVQYMLSGQDGYVKSDNPEIQAYLNEYFNDNEDFTAELTDLITDTQVKGSAYMYAYKNEEDKTQFQCADAMGVIEERSEDATDQTDYMIYWYIDRLNKKGQTVKKILVWDDTEIGYFQQINNGAIEKDENIKRNPRPHTVYTAGDGIEYGASYGFIPMWRMDNNKKQTSSLNTVKDLIDDYDLMASSLSNNLIDFDTPIHVVKGFEGNNLDELQTNLKTKKLIGVDENGGVEIKTVDVPYEARKTKLELDEKNIYRFGMGLNTAGLKDTNATTNIAIKAAYSLLDLKCSKIEIKLKQFLRKLVKVVLDEVNQREHKDYQLKSVYFDFGHEILSNAQENAQIELVEAQRQQIAIGTLLNLATQLDNETILQLICDELDIDYNEVIKKIPANEEKNTEEAQQILNGVDVIE